jgi:lysophospholipase L1-like esterase
MPRLTQAIATAAGALALTAALAVPAVAAQRPSTPSAPAAAKAQYYLALGDSLSVGDQPNAKGVTLPTNQGYADQLAFALRKAGSSLRLYKLGCPGETTGTFLKGGICGYKGDVRTSLNGKTGSQLAAALAFLKAHPGQVPLITIDNGANDLNNCIALGVISKIEACLPPVFKALGTNLAVGVAQLRAADPHATIVGMLYYDPELAEWLTGTSGQQFARASILLAGEFNQILGGVYKKFSAPVADVYTSFDTADITDIVNVPGIGKLPKDVALICRWTYECAPKPVGPNKHANAFGYGVIAGTYLATLKAIKFPV